jgi:GH24 family phage-related lysozyme (muramidase)
VADPVLKLKDEGPDVAVAQELLNRNGAILDADGDFGTGTEGAVREFQTAAGLAVTGVIDAATWRALRSLPEPSPDIPTRAVAFIGREEVGSRQTYDKTCSRPTWPGGASGVTIGIGYDLGYQSTFEADWSDVLTADEIAALKPWLGVKGDRAKPAPDTLTNIVIPWHASWMVFIRRGLPQHVTMTRDAFTGISQMPRLCFGVLVSLVYNRGASVTDSPDRPGNRQEMRDIQKAVREGRFHDIPAALRSMQRLWPVNSGLWLRREREAKLFEEGLAQGRSVSPM